MISAQEYSIDISLNKQEPYSIGENLFFTVRLLEENNQISEPVEVYFTDSLNKKEINKTVVSNEESSILIENDFLSGYWNVKAFYKDRVGEAVFSVREFTDVEFIITGEKLIIKNIGNSRYIKTIQIIIGSEIRTITPNIRPGDKKELRLVAPDGLYNIKVSDGENTFSKTNVHLSGTGKVIGAIDEDLMGYAGLGGAQDPEKLDETFFTLDKLPLALVFIGAVFGVGILILIEKIIRKKYIRS
jgi:hypothetical protein